MAIKIQGKITSAKDKPGYLVKCSDLEIEGEALISVDEGIKFFLNESRRKLDNDFNQKLDIATERVNVTVTIEVKPRRDTSLASFPASAKEIKPVTLAEKL